jgi:periplasmic divalent cation tolerance protein
MNIVIFITTADKNEAKKIARALVKDRLAACVNIVDAIESVFCWQGKIEKAKEAFLVVKTKKGLLPRIIKLVKSLHSYQVPEIIALPVIAGEKRYLDWLSQSVG